MRESGWGTSAGGGRREERHIGQVVWLVSHSSMHDMWNSCLQAGSRRSISSISYSPRHTLHVSPLQHASD